MRKMPRAAKNYMVSVPAGASKPLQTIANPSMRDKVARLSHWMLIYTAGSKERRGKRHHWINISYDRLRAHFGNDYVSVVGTAERIGLIEVNRRYSARKGGFSQSYRLAKRYLRPLIEEFPLSRKPRAKKSVGIAPMNPVGEWLASKLTMFGISPDAKPRRVWDGVSAEAIRHEEHYALRCEFGRFHSVYTAISRYLRSGIILDQKAKNTSHASNLRITDVRNSQPLILATLTRNQGQGIDQHPQHSYKPTLAHIHMSTLNVPNDVLEWLRLCEAGTLYEHLAQLVGWSRADIKKEFLPLLFDRWEGTQQYPLFKLLASEFPSVAAYVESAKRVKYQELARRCQRLESGLCIDGVCGRLMREVPEIPLLTIHDSWIYPTEYEPVVHAAIREVYESEGLRVALSVSDLSQGA